jgi:hypothetical protein
VQSDTGVISDDEVGLGSKSFEWISLDFTHLLPMSSGKLPILYNHAINPIIIFCLSLGDVWAIFHSLAKVFKTFKTSITILLLMF